MTKNLSFRLPRLRFRTTPGEVPGTINVDPNFQIPVIRYISYDSNDFTEGLIESVDQLKDLIHANRVLWVNVDGLGDAEIITAIGDIFSLHRLALEDVVNVGQRPKVEEYDEHVYTVIKMITPDENLTIEQLSIFLTSDAIITFQESSGDCFDLVRERIRNNRGRIRTMKADFLMYALLDAAVDYFFPVLEKLDDRLALLEDEVISKPSHNTMLKIHNLKVEVRSIRRCVWPLAGAIEDLYKSSISLINEDCIAYIRDCHDHILRVIDHVDSLADHASDLMDFYHSAMGHKMNEIMKILTIIASIFIPLTFIAGIYGMNFENMPELSQPMGYPAVLLFMAIISTGMVIYFVRKKWF